MLKIISSYFIQTSKFFFHIFKKDFTKNIFELLLLFTQFYYKVENEVNYHQQSRWL